MGGGIRLSHRLNRRCRGDVVAGPQVARRACKPGEVEEPGDEA